VTANIKNLTNYKKIILLFIVFIMFVSGYLLYQSQSSTNQSMPFIYELDQTEARWTPDQIEEYKLEKTEVEDLVKDENEYRSKIQTEENLKNYLNSDTKLDQAELTNLSDSVENAFGATVKDQLIELNTDRNENSLDILEQDPEADTKVLGTSSTSITVPEVGKREVPSISGANVDKYTGNASYSYGIQIPPFRGNASVSVGLSYSSRSIDDLRANKLGYVNVHPDFYNGRRCEDGQDKCYKFWDDRIFQNSIGTNGLGWSMSSFGSISIDSAYENEYVLSLNGMNVRIKEQNGQFFTYPAGKVKIERYGQFGAWKVTDTSGSVYFFGSIDDSFAKAVIPSPVNNQTAIPVDSANEYMAGWRYGDDSNHTIYCYFDKASKWNLSKISDIHGNTVEINYEQTQYPIVNGCYQTGNTRVAQVKYNYNEELGGYISKVKFNYVKQDVGNPWSKIEDPSINNNPFHFTTALYSVPYSNTYVLDSVETTNGDQLINKYKFDYTKSFQNPSWKFDCPYRAGDAQNKDYCYTNETGAGDKVRQLLLTKITKYGFDGTTAQNPTTFCYNSLTNAGNPEVCNGTNTNVVAGNYKPNDIYLTKVSNGYGGDVTYQYELVGNTSKVCGVDGNAPNNPWEARTFNKLCGGPNTSPRPQTKLSDTSPVAYILPFYRVSKMIAQNGMGQDKVTQYSYIGEAIAYASNFGRTYIGGIPGDTYKKLVGVNGLQFLGYPEVKVKVYDKNDSSKLLSYVDSKTYQYIETDNCFMIDPRKGSEYQNQVLDASGGVLGFTNTEVFVRGGIDCVQNPKNWGEKEVYARSTYSEIDGKKSKSETIYDFDVFGDNANAYGNPVKNINYGNPDVSGDEIYSYVNYLSDKYYEGLANAGDLPSNYSFNDYKNKNLISMQLESFVSDTNYNTPDDVPFNKRLNWQRTLYDQNINNWPNQAGISGVKGLVSSTVTLFSKLNIDDSNTLRQLVNAKIDYNKYGLPVKTTSSDNQRQLVFYDNIFNLLPVCTVSLSNIVPQVADNQGQNELCRTDNNSNHDKNVQKLVFNTSTELLKNLPSYMEDVNGQRARYVFDGLGRVTEVYGPDKDTPQKTSSTPTQKAFYYDNLVPMRTRVQSVADIGSQTIYKTHDTFHDGFGNVYQEIIYNNKDKDGEFALVNYQTFNGVGQVTEKVAGLPVRNLTPGNTPQVVANNVLSANKSKATVEKTTYDFFSRPLSVTNTSGTDGTVDPVTRTIATKYQGYNIVATDSLGNEIKRFYDGLGREVETNTYLCTQDTNCTADNGQVIKVTSQYDFLGNMFGIKDTNGKQIKTVTYNSISMPLSIVDSDRGVVKIYYDSILRPIKSVDANGNVSEKTFDGFGRESQVTVKDASGNVRKIVDSTYDTDKMGQLAQVSVIQKGINSLYDTNPIQKVNMFYDNAGNNIKTISYTADLIAYNDTDTTAKYIEKTDTSSYTSTNVLKEFESTVARSGVGAYEIDSQAFTYETDGKIKLVMDRVANKELVKNIVNDYKGQVLSMEHGNGVRVKNSFDGEGKLLTRTIDEVGTNKVLDTLDQTYTKAGFIKTLTNSQNTNENKVYEYDSLGRLLSVGGEYEGLFSISNVGALNSKKEGSSLVNTIFASDKFAEGLTDPCSWDEYKTTVGYNSNQNGCPYHAPLKSVVEGQTKYFLYDLKGNLIKEVYTNGRIRVFEYGVLDLPEKIIDFDTENNQVNLTRFGYGMGGQRVVKFGRIINDFNFDLDEDGDVDIDDANLFVKALLGDMAGANFDLVDLIRLISQWNGV